MDWTLNRIAIMHSPCKEKFAVPRQSGLAPGLTGQIEILSPYDRDEAFLALDGFSHIWVLGLFHQSKIEGENIDRTESWQTTVRPPRLGGNKRVGVFASRSPNRPNPISLSVFKLIDISRRANKLFLDVSGTDLVDGTPIIDIKPYLRYADSIPDAQGGYVDLIPKPQLSVVFSDLAAKQCFLLTSSFPARLENLNEQQLQRIIIELIQLDPRPAYKTRQNEQEFGLKLFDLNVRFSVNQQQAKVLSLDIKD